MNEGNCNSEYLLSVAASAFRFYLNENSDLLLSKVQTVQPISQNGPECGIAALSMASQLLTSPSVMSATILNAARERNFTLQGEMFSADNMAILAESVCECNAVTITKLEDQKNKIVTHVLEGYPALIPYDSDCNHVPCNKKGHKAHWAIIVGIGLAIPKGNINDENQGNCVYFCEKSDFLRHLDKASKILVCAFHGKSRKLAIWELNELLESNYNLRELAEKHDPTKMIIPQDGDPLGGLRDKAVLLMPKLKRTFSSCTGAST